MMATTKLDHTCHEHPLILVEDFDSSSISAPLVCNLCEISIIGLSPAYICSQEHSPCSFFLHKSCAESPELIVFSYWFPEQFVLKLEGPTLDFSMCGFCGRIISKGKWIYSSPSTYHKVCMRCAVKETVLAHGGHQEHPLTLLRSEACFLCNACGNKAEEVDSYICLTCHYWIHSSCAASPLTIKLRIHEDDTLQLVYSIPKLYRSFRRHCPICRHRVVEKHWAYFCEESGYFIHIKCAAELLVSGKNMIETEDDDGQTYPDLIQFPRPSTCSLMKDLIAEDQSRKLIDTNTIIDTDSGNEGTVIHHWSHPEHPLILLEELKNAYKSDDDESDAKNHIDEMLVCNGCTLPITIVSNKHYYGCIGCNYFLHISCANHLPLQCPPGKCILDPEHTLKLCKPNSPCITTKCQACNKYTNGFTYKCETCDVNVNIDVCCSLAPDRIKHEFHKHPLVKRFTKSIPNNCNACSGRICYEYDYGCEICSEIQIHLRCALKFQKTISHRWDSHSISLIYPPIYYEGIKYCEICELEVNPEAWLYRCSKCDQCFHPLCIRAPQNVKLGSTTSPSTHNLHIHTLTLKVIDYERYASRFKAYVSCANCDRTFYFDGVFDEKVLNFECTNCNYRLCNLCMDEMVFCGRLPCNVPEILYVN